MRLASEDLHITLQGEELTLRPTLRAALQLARKYETFEAVVTGIADGSITVVADVIAATVCSSDVPVSPLPLGKHPLANFFNLETSSLIDLVLGMVGVDADVKGTEHDAERVSFTDHFERLFQIATGMLGWSPSEAWSATPAEILAAHKGRVELLKMIFGTGNTKPRQELTLDQKARLAFASIGTRKAKAA